MDTGADRHVLKLTPALWHAARRWYLRQVTSDECVTISEYNHAVQQVLAQPWPTWIEAGSAALGIARDTFPSPQQVGLFALETTDLVSVVVPVFNEESTILDVLQRLANVPAVAQIIVVDDASRDHTGERLAAVREQLTQEFWTKRLPGGLLILAHAVNQGKGAALRTGFPHATQAWTGVQDADTEYDPNDLMRLLTLAKSQGANVAYGSRFLLSEGGTSPLWHREGNRLITLLANWSFGLRLSDVETCYKLVESSRLKKVTGQLRENRFGIEIELTARLAQTPEVRFVECPITYDRRTYAEGKKIGMRDAFQAVWCMFKYR
ncbi:MAG: glycosyltransferase family 2 protein [Planctomycetaceae bacterium]|nr:glycosyltransferase family 2 protein [Planctomycetaceae bacterium]